MSNKLGPNKSINLTFWIEGVGIHNLPEPRYKADLELEVDKIGPLKITWFLKREEIEVTSYTTRGISEESEEDLARLLLSMKLDDLSYFEKCIFAKKITQVFCSSGLVFTVDDLEVLHQLFTAAHEAAIQQLIDVRDQDADFWSKEKSKEYYRVTGCYYDSWDEPPDYY